MFKGTSRPTNFEQKILSGSKIHTIREDVNNRWRVGMPIQFAVGVRTKHYRKFMDGTCKGRQLIYMEAVSGGILQIAIADSETSDARWMLDDEIIDLARNDGFDSVEEFTSWFRQVVQERGGVATFKLIHWTDKRY
ncbi:hypothetical protein [Larkinella harenae]